MASRSPERLQDVPPATADGREERPEVFRPRLWLRGAVFAATLFWVGIFFALVALQGATDKAFLSVGFFIALFTALGVFYSTTSIEVTREDVIVRGLSSFRLVPLRNVVRVDVKPGLLQTNYAVLARGGLIAFTSLFSGHQRLMQLIVERARLARL